jgi:hypothetical protein
MSHVTGTVQSVAPAQKLGAILSTRWLGAGRCCAARPMRVLANMANLQSRNIAVSSPFCAVRNGHAHRATPLCLR